MPTPYVLFHRISDPESATVRKFIVDNDLKDKIDFRNVDISESAAKDLARYNLESPIPSLWTGERLISGRHQILGFLSSKK